MSKNQPLKEGKVKNNPNLREILDEKRNFVS
jgi:hypothetical protein